MLKKNRDWIEHTGKWNKYLGSILAAHFRSPLSPVKPSVYFTRIPVYVDRGMGVYPSQETVWTVSRTIEPQYLKKNINCYVNAIVAYYVEIKNRDGWPPSIDLISNPESEEKCLKEGDTGLIELRWYDPVGKKRHRWFNHRLASFLQWEEGYSPILLPRVINSLD